MKKIPHLILETQNNWIDQQLKILHSCISDSVDLDSELTSIGKSRDSLRYIKNSKQIKINKLTSELKDFSFKHHGVPVISLFSGCGGADLGFEVAGFQHLALFEHNELFCSTLRHNRPDWNVYGPPFHSGDVSRRDEILDTIRRIIGPKNFDGVIVGGPPCQPFSIASNQRFQKNGDNFKRVGFEHSKNGNLLFDFVWLITQLKPRAFLIENVEGIAEVDGGIQMNKALEILSASGYNITKPFLLNAANYKVPQHRKRLFVSGSLKNKEFIKPAISWDMMPCFPAINKPLDGVDNHETRLHKAESIIRYSSLDFGQRDKLGRVDRLNPNLPSKTIIAGGTNGGGRSHLHPFIPRTLSARECARLQTFPDDYVFLGPTARQFTQIGNAVPPILAAQLATALYNSFFMK